MRKLSEAEAYEAVTLLQEMVTQADEDTPSEYRTEHFREAMTDSINFLNSIDDDN